MAVTALQARAWILADLRQGYGVEDIAYRHPNMAPSMEARIELVLAAVADRRAKAGFPKGFFAPLVPRRPA